MDSSSELALRTRPDDIFVAVMGVTGVGKSTFIDKLTTANVETSDGLQSHTKSINAYPSKYKDHSIWLIDTPGFDDTVRSDIDVLEDLAYWLKKATNLKLNLGGIIHLHRITDTRIGGAAYKDLKMFQKLCGADSFKSVVLGTTMWPENPSKEDFSREEELKTKFYQDMIKDGGKMMRHMNTEESAREILGYLIDRHQNSKPLVLAIQRELAPEGATLIDTGAGRELESEKIKIRETFEEKMKENDMRLQRALDEKDMEMANMRLDKQKELDELLRKARDNEEEIKARLKAEAAEREETTRARIESEAKEREADLRARLDEMQELQSVKSPMDGPPPYYQNQLQGPNRSWDMVSNYGGSSASNSQNGDEGKQKKKMAKYMAVAAVAGAATGCVVM